MSGNSYTRRINLYINGKEVRNNIGSIQGEMRKLINEQRRMTIGSKEYNEQARKIKALRTVINKHNQDLKGTQKRWMSLGKMAEGFNKYFTLFASFTAGFAGTILGLKKTINLYAEFDDKLADVMKTTGLTKIQVKELNEELKKLNTRTAQNNLLDLARIGGKLGIQGKEDLLGFVKAADQINVALSEDLGGGVEESIRQIGKLADIFKIKDQFGTEEALLKIGSAINSLGAASTANEEYMVEFSKRVAGIAPSANINIDKILGLAATLDQLGQSSEVSSTVYSQIIPDMFKDTALYADVAQMSVGGFSKLLKEDANEAFIKVLEGLNGNNAGFEFLVKKLEALGLEGKRSISVIGVLANNTELLREQQKFANAEFEKGTSLTEEFNTKNSTAQAKLEKARKALHNVSVELGQTLAPVLTLSTNGLNYFIKALNVVIPFLIKHKKVIAIVASAIAAYYIRLSALWILEKARGITITQNIAFTRLMIAVTGKATIAQKRLLVTTRALNTATKSSPWGLVITLLATAASAFVTFKNKVKQATDEQRIYNEVLDKSNELLGQSQSLEKKATVIKNMNKRQLEDFKMTLDSQINEEEDFHTKLLEKLKGRLEKDRELHQYNENLKNKDLTDSQREKLKVLIYSRKARIARDLEEENKGNRKRLGQLKGYLALVKTELKNHENPDDNSDGVSNEEALKALEMGHQQHINLLKQQYADQEELDKEFKARMLASELAYLQAKAGLEDDEMKKLKLQENILDKQRAYNAALREAFPTIKTMEERIEGLNTQLLEEAKLLGYIATKQNEAAVSQENLSEKQLRQAEAVQMIGNVVTDYMVSAIDGSIDEFERFGDTLILMSLQILKQMVPILSAQILGLSLASPESVASWGIAGVAKHAALMAILYTAVGAIEGGVKNGIKKRRENANGYEAGGFAHEEQYVVGEKNKKEWIGPNWMVTHPTTGPVIEWLENFRNQRYTVSPFAMQATQPNYSSTVSSTTPTPPPAQAFPSGGLSEESVDKFDKAVDRLTEWKPGISIELFEKMKNQFDEIQDRSGFTFNSGK